MDPLSFLLQKCDGYTVGTQLHRDTKLTHLVFADDLKLFSSDTNLAEQQMDIVTFSKDIIIQFGLEKYAISMLKGNSKNVWEKV